MKMKFSKAILIMVVSLTGFDSMAQSPWLYGKNKGFYQIQTTFLAFPYDELVTGKPSESTLDLNREVNTADFVAYFEYGLSDTWNVIGKIPLRHVSVGALSDEQHNPVLLDEGSLFGISNVEIVVKRRLSNQKLKFAVSLRGILNTVSLDLAKGLATGYAYNGLGVFGHVGGSLGSRGYAFADFGLVKTTHDFSDYFQNHIEGGYKFGRAFSVRLTIDIKKSLKNGDYQNDNLLQTGLSPNDQEWIGFGFGISYETKNELGFNLSTGGAVDAQYLGFAAPITLGVYKKM